MTHPRRIAPRFLTLALLAAALSGCLLSAPSLDPVRHDMEARLPGVVLEPQIQLRLGRMSLGMAKGIARMAMDEEDEDEVFALLRHVKGVEVAIYETDTLAADGARRWSRYVSDLGARRGWVPVAQIRDDATASTVFFKLKGQEIRGVYLFTLDDENLVMARFKGHLDRVVADALALHGNGIAKGLAGGERKDHGVKREDGEEAGGEAAPEAAPAATSSP